MEERGRELRQAIERSRGNRPRWRCPSGLRSEIVEYVSELRDTGQTLAQIGAVLGVSETSLGRWLTAERVGNGHQRASMREVKLAGGTASTAGISLTLRSSGRYGPCHASCFGCIIGGREFKGSAPGPPRASVAERTR